MMVSSQWIPLDDIYEKDLVDKLVAEERAFIKPLRYEARNMPRFPNFRLLDAGPRPVALDILSAFVSDAERAAKMKAIGTRDRNDWSWDTALCRVIPELRPRSLKKVRSRPTAKSCLSSVRTECPASEQPGDGKRPHSLRERTAARRMP